MTNHSINPSQDGANTRNTWQYLYRDGSDGASSSQVPPPHRIRVTRVPSANSDAPRRSPRMHPTPGVPVPTWTYPTTWTPRRNSSLLLQTETIPSPSLRLQANADRALTPQVTVGSRQYPKNAQTHPPTGFNVYHGQDHVLNQPIQDQGANRTFRIEQESDEMAPINADEGGNEFQMLEEPNFGEEQERRQLRIPNSPCNPNQDSRNPDDDPPDGADGDRSTKQLLARTTRASLKRSQETDNQQRKRLSTGRERMEHSERDAVTEKFENPEFEGPDEKASNVFMSAPSTSADKSKIYKTRPGVIPASHFRSLRKQSVPLAPREGPRMEKVIHPASSGNSSHESLVGGGSNTATANGSEDDGIATRGRIQDKKNTSAAQDRSRHLTKASASDSVDPLRSDGSRQVRKEASALVRTDSPEIEAWLEEPWIPRQHRRSSQHIIRSKEVIIYRTSPAPARSRRSHMSTPPQDEPSLQERQERLRLHQATMRR